MHLDFIKKENIFLLCFLCLLSFSRLGAESEVRLKDMVDVAGVRANQLYGYGLVVGLKGTGDKSQTVFTAQSLTNLLDKMGVAPSKISKFGLKTSGSEMKVKNVAAVFVTAELNPFIRSGTRIDVTVSSIGDSKSLEGGTLVMTALQGADGSIYAVAQGPISIGGLSGNTTQPGHVTVAYIPQGAFVEREVPGQFLHEGNIHLTLRSPDFTTTQRILDRINQDYPGSAFAKDSGSIAVQIPIGMEERVIEFVATLEQMKVRGDAESKIIINERTGTIVTGENVTISPVAVSHGTLSVSIRPEEGETHTLDEAEGKVLLVKESVSVGEVAKSLNLLGVTPTDMIAIFQVMLRSGAIRAKLEIM